MESKKLSEAYILGIPFGLFWAHHFYLGRRGFGKLYLFTVGLFGLGYLFDLVRMRWLVQHVNRHGTDRKMLSDCYIIWLIGGLFGAHHFYLGNRKLGVFYVCTLGICGLGWLVDFLRMKWLLKAANDRSSDHCMTRITAYTLCFSPFGLIGAHHFYIERYRDGGVYIFSFFVVGLFGVFGLFGGIWALSDERFPVWYIAIWGVHVFRWFVDALRLSVLYERFASKDEHAYLDEAYIYWFPFGLIGLHQFYLKRRQWGILYACTLGCLGIGWLLDCFNLPGLVMKYNEKISGTTMNYCITCKRRRARERRHRSLAYPRRSRVVVERPVYRTAVVHVPRLERIPRVHVATISANYGDAPQNNAQSGESEIRAQRAVTGFDEVDDSMEAMNWARSGESETRAQPAVTGSDEVDDQSHCSMESMDWAISS